MYGTVRDAAARDAGRDPRRRALQARAASSPRRSRRTCASGGARRAELLRQQLPRPGRPSRRRRGGARRARRVGLRDGQRAVHLRHADPAHRARARLSQFLGTEATILYSSCFDANGGVFEVLLDERDAVISDELNHASIIDGIRLCKAQRLPLPQPRHGRPRGAAAGGGRRAAPADRHRRRVLDGRLPRPARRDLRPGRALRRAGDGRRLARGRASSGRPARARPSCSACRTASTSSPARSARRSAARPAATSAARAEIVELLRQRSRPVPVLQRGRARRSSPARWPRSSS